MESYDVVIAGAGPGGSTAALALARAGARVLLVDRAAFPRDKPCAEYLSPEINVMLRELGLTAAIETLRPAHLRGFRVVAQNERDFLGTFAGCSDGSAERGYGLSIPRTQFDTALLRAAIAAGATWQERTRVMQLVENDAVAAVRLARGGTERTVRAQAVIAADGIRSIMARQLGVMERRRPHRIALVSHMMGIDDLDDYGEMHLSPAGGYCGVAPFADGRANVAMVVDRREGPSIAGDPATYLRAALTAYPNLARRVRGAALCKPILTTSALSWMARRVHVRRVALVGDATGYYDPFTGEGIYRAMAGGRLVAHHLVDGLAWGGIADTLARYERALRRLYRGKRLVERAIDMVVQQPLLFGHVAERLRRHPEAADILVGVTGDFLPPWAVLNPAYLARLLV